MDVSFFFFFFSLFCFFFSVIKILPGSNQGHSNASKLTFIISDDEQWLVISNQVIFYRTDISSQGIVFLPSLSVSTVCSFLI